MHLGEEQTALQNGEQGDGQVIRTNSASEMPLGVKLPQSLTEGFGRFVKDYASAFT